MDTVSTPRSAAPSRLPVVSETSDTSDVSAMMAATSSASPGLQRGVPPASDAPHAAPLTLEAVVLPKLRAYEEQLLVELAAGLFREFAQRDGVPRAEIARLLADYPPSAVHLVFSRYDAAGAGVLGAHAFLALVRYLNFGNGFCDACFAPIGERERGFMCVECRASGYILCARCFPQRGAFHPGGGIAHRFLPAAEMLELLHPSGREDALPRGVGVLLRAHLTARLAAMDPAGRGFVSRDEFRAHQRAQGCAESYTEFLLALDGGGDRISKRRLLLLAAGQHLLRQCDECGALQFAGGGQVLSCLECVADYDVCAACWLASRCRHEHCHFGAAEPFQLRFAGLHYRHAHTDLWALAVGNYELWARYEPFLRHRLTGLARLGPPRAYGHYVVPSNQQQQQQQQSPTDFALGASPFQDANNPLYASGGGGEGGEVLGWFLD